MLSSRLVSSLILMLSSGAFPWTRLVLAEEPSSPPPQNDSGECLLCPGESLFDHDKPLALPDPYSYLKTCGQVASVAKVMLRDGSEECDALKSFETYCGCPIPDNACRLCGPEGLTVRNKTAVIDFTNVPLLGESFVTCEIVEAYLHSISAESDQCSQGQEFRQACDCGEPTDGSSITEGNNTTNDQQDSVPVDTTTSCSLCQDGSSVGFPEKDITSYVAAAGADKLFPDGSDDSVVTCQLAETLLGLLEEESQSCSDIRYLLSGICGCPVPPMDGPACVFCVGGKIDEDTIVYSIQDYTIQGRQFPPARCGDIKLFAEFQEKSDKMCFYARQVRHLCGCNGGLFNYLDSGMNPDHMARKKALAWNPRATAILSLLGSALIMRDILTRRRSNRVTAYHHLVFGMSFFDAIGSIGWLLSTLPIPEYTTGGDPTRIYGARGTDKTCTAQGFLLQLAYTSIFYNVSLSVYYLFTIRYGWREARIRSFVKWFHIPVVLGLGYALAGIPFYDNAFFVCHLVPPPLAKDFRVIVWLVMVPIATGMVLATVNMCLVYLYVRAQDARASRWRFDSRVSTSASTISQAPTPSRGLNKLERAVFWQSIFYLVAFYFTWPLTIVAYSKNNINLGYPFWLTTVTLAPLQGLLNAIVYFRPYLAQKLTELQSSQAQEQPGIITTKNFWCRASRRRSQESSNQLKSSEKRERVRVAEKTSENEPIGDRREEYSAPVKSDIADDAENQDPTCTV